MRYLFWISCSFSLIVSYEGIQKAATVVETAGVKIGSNWSRDLPSDAKYRIRISKCSSRVDDVPDDVILCVNEMTPLIRHPPSTEWSFQWGITATDSAWLSTFIRVTGCRAYTIVIIIILRYVQLIRYSAVTSRYVEWLIALLIYYWH